MTDSQCHGVDNIILCSDSYKKHDGRLPVRIRAVSEGSVVPVKNALFTVENTHPQCYWLTNFLETLLVQVWYPMTVATNSYYQKQVISRYLIETADNLDSLPYKLHDFGYRGSTVVEAAGIGAAAHLVNFVGTDTLAGLVFARKYYNCTMAGFSIPAAEHSTITTWGSEREVEAFRNMLESFPAPGAVAVVSDSYDVHAACRVVWGDKLRAMVIERGAQGGVLVVRPDSGDPAKVVLEVLGILGEKFGRQKNSKGFWMLPSYLRVIQGDGVSYESLAAILENLKKNKWSAENVVFGSGGALLQRVDRDTQKCAYKCSFAVVDGKPTDVYKDPKTDPGKKSKRGRLLLEKTADDYVTHQQVTENNNSTQDEMVTVFENGRLLKEWSLEEIRQRAQLPQRNNNKT